jgi:hypothetical protein
MISAGMLSSRRDVSMLDTSCMQHARATWCKHAYAAALRKRATQAYSNNASIRSRVTIGFGLISISAASTPAVLPRYFAIDSIRANS